MNTLVTPSWVTNEVAIGFMNSVKGVANFDRRYSDEFVQAGAKVGDSVRVRLPQRWEVTDGQAFQQQNILDQTVYVTLTNQKGVHMGWSSAQGTLEVDNVRDRYIGPAADALANAADVLALASVYQSVYNAVGTIGTTPSAALTFLQAGVKLDDGAVEESRRVAVLDTLAAATLASGVSTLFNPVSKISETWRKGQFGADQLNIDEWFKDQNMPKHTTGASTTATPLVNGAGQTGSSLVTDGWGSGNTTLQAGDYFTIAGVYGVNPLSYVSTGRLQQFVVTTTVTDTTGAVTASISPSIITTGPLRTVTASPADNAVISYLNMAAGGSQTAVVSPQSMVWHKDAFAFVMADLVMPNGGAKASRVSSQQFNVALRYTEQWQALTDQNLSRIDMLIGAAPIQPRLACRVVG